MKMDHPAVVEKNEERREEGWNQRIGSSRKG